MTDASVPRASPNASPIRPEMLIIGIVALLALVAVSYVLSQRQQELRSSPVGLDGLQIWLTSEGGDAQNFSGGWLLDPGTIGLMVLPVYDTDLDRESDPPRTKDDLLFQQDESDLDWYTLDEKIEAVPTLIVLPKWRSGMRLTGIAHPDLLVEERRLNAFLKSLTGLGSVQVSRAARAFTALPYTSSASQAYSAELYAAQLFDGTDCDPLIGSGAETLLASCPLAGSDQSVLILSDPDLLNNHGLRLGQNALIAKDFLLASAGDGKVVIDYSRDNWLSYMDEAIQRERTWSDLLRFFEPPFLAIWLGAGLTLALALWRSIRRAGPVVRSGSGGVSKMQAIRARARLMRLTGQDGAMLADLAAARIASTAARLVGPGQARQIGEEQAFLRYVGRRRPDLADRLAEVLGRLHALPPRLPPQTAIHHVDDLEQVLELIANDT